MTVGPHPHIGLSTVTWLLDGEALHTDGFGSEQLIRPGQLNLMTAGDGIAHAEETPADRTGSMHGVQFWVAQPDSTRHGPAAFEHHGELPVVVALDASVRIDGSSDGGVVGADTLVHLASGATSLCLEATDPVRLLLLGGEPFESDVLMWWNFVARTHDEVDEAVDAWSSGSERFGEVDSGLARIPAPTPARAAGRT